MGGRDDVLMIDESATANINRFLWILLQNRYLPWILSEFTVTIDVNGCLNATSNSISVSATALSCLGLDGGGTGGTTAAHMSGTTLLRYLIVGLTLKKIIEMNC